MDLFETIEGATPIPEAERENLVPTHITTRQELNEWEAANILKATRKYLSKRRRFDFNVELIKDIHKEMFDETWKWAGMFRLIDLNMGVDWHTIQTQVKNLVDDLTYWQEHEELLFSPLL